MLIIGHRGALGLAPENTTASFLRALDAGVDMIELDIRTSADGKLVVNHDPTIGSLAISNKDYKTLLTAKPDLLQLHEALAVIGARCPVIIEIKKGTNIPVAIKALKDTLLPQDIQFCSFNIPALFAVRSAFPKATLTVNEKWSGVRGSYRCRKLGTTYLAMNQRWLWFGFIRSMSRSGYNLSAYSLNNAQKARKWARYGLYAVVTDFPDRFTASKS